MLCSRSVLIHIKALSLSIYDSITLLRRLPFLPDMPQAEYDSPVCDIMNRTPPCIPLKCSVRFIARKLRDYPFCVHFPIVLSEQHPVVVGSVGREPLESIFMESNIKEQIHKMASGACPLTSSYPGMVVTLVQVWIRCTILPKVPREARDPRLQPSASQLRITPWGHPSACLDISLVIWSTGLIACVIMRESSFWCECLETLSILHFLSCPSLRSCFPTRFLSLPFTWFVGASVRMWCPY